MNTDTQNKVALLVKQIRAHKDLYYNNSTKENIDCISDAAFDALEDELRRLAPTHPIFSSIGSKTSSEWKKATHKIPMGSLDKINNDKDLSKWIKNSLRPDNTLFITEKLDGLSIEVIYEAGKLIQAITRGDGVEGDDITSNILLMQGVKDYLPINFTGSLRGEIILKKSIFQSNVFFQEYANTRNAASGISKRLDGEGCRYLTVLFYQVISEDIKNLKTEKDHFNYLLNILKLGTPNFYLSQYNDQHNSFAADLWNKYQQEIRNALDWEIDGLVLRVNELQDQVALGELHLRPKGAIAFKFPSESAISKVKAIHLQVGNNGRITPVLEIEPVKLVGVNVNRASLYNFAYIKKLGINIGSSVVIVRANDVIPRCEAVISQSSGTFQIPTKCPVCGGKVSMIGENLQCIEVDTCPAQVVGRLKNWINALNILEWGDKLLSRLVENATVSTIADLYKLSVADLSAIERMGQKSAQKCFDTLWAKNPIPLDVFIGGMSIPMVGSSTIQLLMAAGLDTLEKICNASLEKLQTIKGIGTTRAESLIQGLRKNKSIIDELLSAGVKITTPDSKSVGDGKLAGMRICITGSTNIKRDDLAKSIILNGGIFKDILSKDCTHLVVADPNKKSKKLDSAAKYGTQIISEADLLKLLS